MQLDGLARGSNLQRQRSHGLSRAAAIKIASQHTDGLAGLGRTQQQRVGCRADDGQTIGLPLVADRTQAVGISQRVGSRERLALYGRT